eukprot:1654590-Alexandrium_andersonii.AAC.1
MSCGIPRLVQNLRWKSRKTPGKPGKDKSSAPVMGVARGGGCGGATGASAGAASAAGRAEAEATPALPGP